MKNAFRGIAVILFFAAASYSQTAPDEAKLKDLLNNFLTGIAGKDAVATHDRFWADDLIYTRGSGQRIDKAELMKGVRSSPAPRPDDPVSAYSAEDVRVQQYGNAAVVAFRLVSTTTDKGKVSVTKFYNTGTFIKRRGEWRAVAWQATRIPDAKK